MLNTYALLILINVLNLFYLFVIDKLPISYQAQLEIWSITVMILLLLSSISIVRLVPYKQTGLKLLSFMTAISTLWWFLDLLIYTLLDNGPYENILSLAFLAIYIAVCVPLIFYQVFRSYKAASDTFNNKGTFCVYKKPKSFFGIFPAIFGRDPFGHRMLVIDGHEFSFKRVLGEYQGVMAEKPHVQSTNYFYRKIQDVDIEQARKLIGLKWSIWRNCYVVYNNIIRAK